jgi:hypothetical protein
MEGIMGKFANKYNAEHSSNQHIKICKSGPAMTLKIGVVCIDLVPVFGFKTEPPKPIRCPKPLNRVRNIFIEEHTGIFIFLLSQMWFIVPKPEKENSKLYADDAWRVSFYQFEKDILSNFGKIKPAIKLVKVNFNFFCIEFTGTHYFYYYLESTRQAEYEEIVQLCHQNCSVLDD